MTISKDEVLELMCAFHDVVMLDKGDAAPQGEFFLYRDPLIFIPPHSEDLSLRQNHQIHQGLADEKHVPLDPWTLSQLCDQSERARAVGAVYWEGRPIDSRTGTPIKCVVDQMRRRRGLDSPTRRGWRTQDRPLHQLLPPIPSGLRAD